MLRFPPIPPSQQTPAQKQAQDELESLGSAFGKHLTTKDHEGTMLGPFVPLLSVPPSSLFRVHVQALTNCLPFSYESMGAQQGLKPSLPATRRRYRGHSHLSLLSSPRFPISRLEFASLPFSPLHRPTIRRLFSTRTDASPSPLAYHLTRLRTRGLAPCLRDWIPWRKSLGNFHDVWQGLEDHWIPRLGKKPEAVWGVKGLPI